MNTSCIFVRYAFLCDICRLAFAIISDIHYYKQTTAYSIKLVLVIYVGEVCSHYYTCAYYIHYANVILLYIFNHIYT